MRQSSSEKHSRDSFFFRTQKPKGKVSFFLPSARCVHCPVVREWSTSIIVLPAQAPDICAVTFLAYLLSLVCSSKRSQIDWARGTRSFCRRGRVGMTDIDSGSRGKKKWLKMGISNGGLSSFARIVHRAEGRYRRESRLACTIFLNFARRRKERPLISPRPPTDRSIDVAPIHGALAENEIRMLLPPFHPDIHPPISTFDSTRRKRERRTQSRLKNG